MDGGSAPPPRSCPPRRLERHQCASRALQLQRQRGSDVVAESSFHPPLLIRLAVVVFRVVLGGAQKDFHVLVDDVAIVLMLAAAPPPSPSVRSLVVRSRRGCCSSCCRSQQQWCPLSFASHCSPTSILSWSPKGSSCWHFIQSCEERPRSGKRSASNSVPVNI